MNILHVTAGIQETCGVSRFVIETARAQIRGGHKVCVVTSMTCGYPIGDVQVQLTNDPTKFNFQPDIIHLHSIWNWYVHKMAVWSRKKEIPYIISPHGTLTRWALRYKWWKKLPAMLLYQYKDLKKANGFHVTVKEEASDIFRMGLKQPVTVAPLGVERLPDTDIHTEYRDIMFLGRIHPVKNLDSLLKAWSDIPSSIRDGWRIIIAGPDDVGYQAELKTLANELALSVRDFSHELEFGKKQIHGGGEVPLSVYHEKMSEAKADVVFTGPVYSETKNWLYQQSKYFILPSHSENFGGVVIEALAGGTPCITTQGTPWASLVENDCGWWVEDSGENLKDILQKAISMDDEDYKRMSVNARSFVSQNYSWAATAKILVEAYQNILRA